MTKKSIRMAHRSGTRECPICERTCALVEHHIHGRDVPRANEQSNIAWICSVCHDEVHTDIPNRIIIEGWFRTTKGRELVWRRKGEPPIFLDGATPPIFGARGDRED